MAVTAVYNWAMSVELWKGRVKKIESHFGSAIASYFTFLRWVIGLNAVIAILLAAFVIIPEVSSFQEVKITSLQFLGLQSNGNITIQDLVKCPHPILIQLLLFYWMLLSYQTLAGDWTESGERKRLLKEDWVSAFDLKTLWVFEGILRYSPIFYGFYGNKESTREGYRLPLAYILTSMFVYGYSFVAILRK